MTKIKNIPNWLKALPHGKYSLNFLAKHTNKHKQSLIRTFKNLGLKKEYQQNEGACVLEVYYIWDGKDKRKEL